MMMLLVFPRILIPESFVVDVGESGEANDSVMSLLLLLLLFLFLFVIVVLVVTLLL